MSNPLDTKATSQYINLVTFKWENNATVARYCASDKPYIDAGALGFDALPQMTINFGKQGGGVEDEPITIQLPVVEPVATMLFGYPFSKVLVTVEEVDITDPTTRRIMFFGTISLVTGNKQGNSAMAEIKIAGLRSWLEYPLGIPATNTCAWNFGDKNCGKDVDAITVNVVVASVVGTKLNLSSPISDGDFHRGSVTYPIAGGLSLLIRTQISTTQLEMVNLPPPSWTGRTVRIRPGCRKNIADCTKWAKLINFGGFGVGIPSFHPSVETQ